MTNIDKLNIYCDESGSTGADLLNKQQKYFVYSSVSLSDDQAKRIRAFMIRQFNYRGNEIKGNRLANNRKNHYALEKLYSRFGSQCKMVYHEKEYVACCKIIEYFVEPFLRFNTVLYNDGLQNYLANKLYQLFKAHDHTAQTILSEFILISRGTKTVATTSLREFTHSDWLMNALLQIIQSDNDRVIEEINNPEGKYPYILEITSTSLMILLSSWYNECRLPLAVICDESDVFRNSPQVDYIDGLGNSRSHQIDAFNQQQGYDLFGPINYAGNSTVEFGLQVADLFASTFNYALSHKNLNFSKNIFKSFMNKMVTRPNTGCVVADVNFDENNRQKGAAKLLIERITDGI